MVPVDEAQWPVEWKTIFFKEYPRVKRIALPEVSFSGDLQLAISNRKSRRVFSKQSLNTNKLSALFKHACGVIDEKNQRRAYPSAGKRFPLEAYLLVFHPTDLIGPGVYHYAIKGHALEELRASAFSSEEIRSLFTYSFAEGAGAALIFTAKFDRNQMKYGDRGYRQILLEAGHMGQNVYLLSEALNISCCALTGTNDEAIEKLLDIDGVTESLVYAFLLG